jgi:hypothetical protein
MRIKALVCAAALAAGAVTTMAQSNVYSLNVVGYINLSLGEGFNLVANQLDADGTGANNFIYNVFGSSLPEGSQVYTYSAAGGGSWTAATFKTPLGKSSPVWNAAGTNNTVNPGAGAFVYIPAGKGAQTVTTVGQVLQGSLSNTNIPSAGGYAVVSSQIPLAGGLQSVLGYTPGPKEKFFFYNNATSSYSSATYSLKLGTTTYWWGAAGEPIISVGEAFWGDFNAGSTWTTNFTVAP